MGYSWSRDGVRHAMEDVMREHPELVIPYEVADARDGGDYTWHVELDPQGDRRIARLSWQMLENGQIEEIAEQLRGAAPAW